MTKETCRKGLAVALSTVLALCIQPVPAQAEGLHESSGLSPYWEPVVSRWEHIIVRYAEMRGLDPDLVAAIIWKESKGVATVRGPTGAVGLMCIKPFPWRPDAAELVNPWTNVETGTRTLAQVMRDGNGDAYYALAAYNGGWEQIHLGVTQRYAADVLGHYVRAAAVENGLSADGDWVAILSVEGLPDHRTVTVLGPDRALARYTERPWSRAKVPAVPEGRSPHATLFRFEHEHGREVRVNVWLLKANHLSSLVGEPLASSLFSSEALGRGFEGLPA